MQRRFREPNEITRAKLRTKKSGVNNPMWGKNHTEETKRKISQALKAYWENVPSSKK